MWLCKVKRYQRIGSPWCCYNGIEYRNTFYGYVDMFRFLIPEMGHVIHIWAYFVPFETSALFLAFGCIGILNQWLWLPLVASWCIEIDHCNLQYCSNQRNITKFADSVGYIEVLWVFKIMQYLKCRLEKTCKRFNWKDTINHLSR